MDEYGYWENDHLIKADFSGKHIHIGKENIDSLIEYYQSMIVPWKPLMVEIYTPMVEQLKELKIKLNW